MCGPAAITLVNTGVQMGQQVLNAQAQNERAKATWENDYNNLTSQYTAIQTKETQEAQRAQLQVIQAQKAGMSAAGRLRVQSAAGDVGGRTIQERTQQPANAVSDFTQTVKQNLTGQLAQDQLDANSFRARAQSIINENPAVNPAAEGLDLAGDALQGAGKAYQQLNPNAGA